MNTKRERPYGPNARGPRHDRYAAAIKRMKEAMDAGFNVEAIAIEESLICDRLESIANELSDGKFSYRTIGGLTDYLLGGRQKTSISSELVENLSQIKEWAKKRNNAVHELAKLTPDMHVTFKESYDSLKDVTTEGLRLFRELDNLIRKQRRKQTI